jgi:hypothetical protein
LIGFVNKLIDVIQNHHSRDQGGVHSPRILHSHQLHIASPNIALRVHLQNELQSGGAAENTATNFYQLIKCQYFHSIQIQNIDQAHYLVSTRARIWINSTFLNQILNNL